jgi:hypothetical protein
MENQMCKFLLKYYDFKKEIRPVLSMFRGLSKQSGKKKSCVAISKNPLPVLSSICFMG